MVDNIRMDNLNLSEKIMSKILVTSINNHKIQIVVQLIHTLCMQPLIYPFGSMVALKR